MSQHTAIVPAVHVVGAPAIHLPAPAPSRPAVLAGPPDALLPRRARDLTLSACRAWQLADLADRATLVADELVTNAVVHARTFTELHLWVAEEQLVVAVHDTGPAFQPAWWDRSPGSGDDEPDGPRYGLHVVRMVADWCGGQRHPAGGKVMWAALATGRPAGGVRRPVPLQRTVTVNGTRRPGGPHRPRWRLELLLTWHPSEPGWVGLTLRPTPLHAAFPRGHWRITRDNLTAGLADVAGVGEVHLYPEDGGRTVLLELDADPPHVVHASRRALQAFLADVDDAVQRSGGDHVRP